MNDRYTKAVLTVIAAALVWNVVQQSIPSARARGDIQRAHIVKIDRDVALCLANEINGKGSPYSSHCE